MSALTRAIALTEQLFEELRAHTTDEPGITRAAYGEGEEFAHAVVRRVGRELGLNEAIDAAGNLYLTLEGEDPTLPGWIIGSHIDSVPHGGNYDGAAGVLAGLAVVHALRTEARRLARNLTVMVIRAEESTWFPVSYLGSRAAFGILPVEALETRRADTGLTLREHMAALGFDPDAVARGEAYLAPPASTASSRCISSRGRCWSARTRPSASSPASPARSATARAACSASTAIPARCRAPIGRTR